MSLGVFYNSCLVLNLEGQKRTCFEHRYLLAATAILRFFGRWLFIINKRYTILWDLRMASLVLRNSLAAHKCVNFCNIRLQKGDPSKIWNTCKDLVESRFNTR